jgi:glucose-6-phosphate 1-epimerase
MAMNAATQEIEPGSPARVAFLDGQGELPMLEVTTALGSAEIYLQGSHVTRFQKRNESPLLFISQCSRFTEGQPIRGGIPLIFPWFGAREGMSQHGFARNKAWNLKEVLPLRDGSVSLRFQFPDCPEASTFGPFTAEYLVTVSDVLELALTVQNNSTDESLTFENCLHTYFEVSDITAITVTGLKGLDYLDKVSNFSRKTELGEDIRFSSEVDRIYLDAAGPVEIMDPRNGRRIRVEKQGSASTIIWNPWITKAQQMPDFGNEEYRRMVCVESGNVGPNELTLKPGERSLLKVKLSSESLT